MAANSEFSPSADMRILPTCARRQGALALVLLVVVYFLYGDSLVRVVKTFRRPEFSHGYIILLIATCLIWQRRELIWEPTTCLPGAGWKHLELGPFETSLNALSGRQLIVNRGVVADGQRRVVFYCWLELRGANAVGQEARLRNLWSSILHGRNNGRLVRMFTPPKPGEAPAGGDAQIRHFLERAYLPLEPHLGTQAEWLACRAV